MNVLPRKGKSAVWRRLAFALFNLGLLPLLTARPAISAEHISLSYGVLRQLISINTLETYTSTGKLDYFLAAHTPFTSPKQLTQLRQILLTRLPIEVHQVAPLLHTPMGEQLVSSLTALIQNDISQPSSSAIRDALIQAAVHPDGLTLLNVLRQFPDDPINIDLARSLRLIDVWRTFAEQTNQAIAQINQQADLEASTTAFSADAPALDLRQQGEFTWEQYTLTLTDRSRDRTFPVDIYLPHIQHPRPVIVISHGLSYARYNFAYLAQHLASYGFVVAVPEHPGSSLEQLRSLLEGKVNQIVQLQEFIDRPRDISYLLDELNTLSKSNPAFQKRLNLQQVGVIGQSFGGYTALVLAGATLQFDQLETSCHTFNPLLNPSLLLQCRALALPHVNYNLDDPRVKAAILINPVGSQLIEQASLNQIKIPILMIAGSSDILAPVLLEQIQPFSWLRAQDKYLALIAGGTHFSSVVHLRSNVGFGSSSDAVTIQHYTSALSTAFAQTYIANQSTYRPYVSAAYARDISQNRLRISLVRSLPPLRTTLKSANGSDFSRYFVALGVSSLIMKSIYFVTGHVYLKRNFEKRNS
ncbi:alpha/beta hydrolase [Oculatella sp. LEGE 06141]|uniref:alpha/beta hydrolase n=1 Tax=Oculatella sp. LEGE 06141 TaxID=1828648 RepID=UPI00187FAD9B|nr:alpha/beta hydrolase [Oculatella sp. LEGE 06141]MBE9183123.1 alpha/beta hydrolase [Oculatella sp. LEGE 06141]